MYAQKLFALQNGQHFKEKMNCSPIISSLLTFTASHNFTIMKCNKHRIFFLFLFCFFLKPLFKACYSQPVKLTNQLKVCQDKWSSWPVTVCWPGVILSPTTVIFISHYLCAQLPHLNKLLVAFFAISQGSCDAIKSPTWLLMNCKIFLVTNLVFSCYKQR